MISVKLQLNIVNIKKTEENEVNINIAFEKLIDTQRHDYDYWAPKFSG